MTSAFTFVNTVDAPSLSASSAKAMRAHVTKTNFANRRKRIAVDGYRRGRQAPAEDAWSRFHTFVEGHAQAQPSAEEQTSSDAQDGQVVRRTRQRFPGDVRQSRTEEAIQDVPAQEELNMLTLSRPTDPFLTLSYRKLSSCSKASIADLLTVIHHFAPVMFPSEPSQEQQPSRQLWASLLINEPAFCEATLAIGVTYRPARLHIGHISTPEGHAGRAISIINNQLSDPRRALSDGMLAAVFTLAWHEVGSPSHNRELVAKIHRHSKMGRRGETLRPGESTLMVWPK